MAGIADTVRVRLNEARIRRPSLDHLVRTIQHYGRVQGNTQAGAVTFFGFLSIFPLLALAFFVVGQISRVYPGASGDLEDAIAQVLPGVVGPPDGIPLSDFQDAAGAAGLIGVLGLLYSGLNLLSNLRMSLLVVFEKPIDDRPSFVVGKSRDLVALLSLGAVLLLSVSVSGVVNFLSTFLLELVGLDDTFSWLVRLLSIVVGIAVSTVLFLALFRLLARPLATPGALWQGALLGALGFELLKQVSQVLISSTRNQPAFAVFGAALVLLVWVNYSARVTMIAASWVQTSEGARLLRQQRDAAEQARIDATAVELRKRTPAQAAPGPKAFAAGALATMGGVFALQRRNRFRARNR